MAGPLVQALVAHCDSVFQGPNGDYPALLETLAGVSAVQAAWKPAPGSNSIWRIVEHLIASKEWQIEMLARGRAAAPVWRDPSGDQAAWQAALDRLTEAHTRLKAALEKVPETELLEIPASETKCTLLELLLSSGPAHEAHHIGQIDYLKGLQAG
jgi:hypothetical protein